MKLALMQPYFLPYIGYWQLMHASDTFVLLDDVQYIRGGWIERNRILNPRAGWQYMSVPLQRHAHTAAIREVRIRQRVDWKRKVLAQLSHYRRHAPHYEETRTLVQQLLESAGEESIAALNAVLVRGIAHALGLACDIRVASQCGFDYGGVAAAGDWALRISQQVGASTYINPVGGAPLFDPAKFDEAGIALRLLQPHPVVYDRKGTFEPSLSIVDVLMFTGIEGTKALLPCYDLKAPAKLT